MQTKQLEKTNNLTDNKLPVLVSKTNSAFDVFQLPDTSKVFNVKNEVESNFESPDFFHELKHKKSNQSESEKSSDDEDTQSKLALPVNNDLFSPMPLLP